MTSRPSAIAPDSPPQMASPRADRARGSLTARLLAGNALWNIAGSSAPLLVGLFAMPALIAALGTDRFGVLSLAWTLIGYFSLFDFGLGRALTKEIAEKLGSGKFDEIPAAFWNALALLLAIGAAAAFLVAISAHELARSVLRVPPTLENDTVAALYWIAAAIPAVTLSSGLRGSLEALQDFRAVNIVRVLMGSLGFLAPLAALPFSHKLYVVVMMLAFTRFIGMVVYAILSFRIMPELRLRRGAFTLSLAPMIRFGGWITIDNIIGPLMVSMDRFFISALLTIGVVAYYSTPSDMMMRLLIVPIALQSVLFAAFSRMSGCNIEQIRKLYKQAIDATLLIMFPPVVLALLFANEGLYLWLGNTFAVRSSGVLRIFAVGILLNAIAHVPSTLLQSVGRPDLNVRIHLIELPIYCVGAFFLIKSFGIEGAAFAWLLRVGLDAALFLYFGRRWVPGMPFRVLPLSIAAVTLSIALIMVAAGASLPLKAVLALVVLSLALRISLPALRGIVASRAN